MDIPYRINQDIEPGRKQRHGTEDGMTHNDNCRELDGYLSYGANNTHTIT